MSRIIPLVTRALPVACTLSEQSLAQRREELVAGILSQYEALVELEDGYALRFPGNRDWLGKLGDFIMFERECCAFFTFELAFEPANGPLWLRLRGGEGVKQFVKETLLINPAGSRV